MLSIWYGELKMAMSVTAGVVDCSFCGSRGKQGYATTEFTARICETCVSQLASTTPAPTGDASVEKPAAGTSWYLATLPWGILAVAIAIQPERDGSIAGVILRGFGGLFVAIAFMRTLWTRWPPTANGLPLAISIAGWCASGAY